MTCWRRLWDWQEAGIWQLIHFVLLDWLARYTYPVAAEDDYYFFFGGLYPAYVRGEAYLAARQGREAAAEFQKILDHRGIVVSDSIGALAHLQLGRAYVMLGDKTKAKSAYQDLLTLWKDADPDIAILKQAQVEYARLS